MSAIEQKNLPRSVRMNFVSAAFGFSEKTAAIIAATSLRERQSRKNRHACLIACVSGANSLSAMPVRDAGARSGLSSADKDRLKALERENKELWTANEIPKKASAYFAQAKFDRPFRR